MRLHRRSRHAPRLPFANRCEHFRSSTAGEGQRSVPRLTSNPSDFLQRTKPEITSQATGNCGPSILLVGRSRTGASLRTMLTAPHSGLRERRHADLTEVELLWLEKRIENRIRFGRIIEERKIDRQRRVLSFAPGSIFAFVRWTSNDFGTVISRIDILRAVRPGQRCSTVPYVAPGGEILLRLSGWPKVERVLQMTDAVEALGIDPADVAPDHWHHVHNRLSVNENPRSYTNARHQAWLHRQKVMR